jgi:hypothetical protein
VRAVAVESGIKMKEGQSLEEKLKELQSSPDNISRKTYELLVLMIKNTKTSLNSELPGYWEISKVLNVEENQISKLKNNINAAFKIPILLKEGRSLNKFNPTYFFDLREAIQKCNREELPPITFQQLLLSAREQVPENCHNYSQYYYLSGFYIRGHQLYAVKSDEWRNRPPEWALFEDVAPPKVMVFAYEEKPECLQVKAIASKINDCLEILVEALKRVAKDRVVLEIEEELIEPVGKTLGEIRAVLDNEENKRKGYVPLAARTLLKCSTSEVQYNQPILMLLKSKGWIREEREDDPWRGEKVDPFVSLAYNEYLTEEEKRKYQTFGLSTEGVIDSYYGSHGDQPFEVSIRIPYVLSSDPSFPFSIGEKVTVRMRGNEIIIKKRGRRGRNLSESQ